MGSFTDIIPKFNPYVQQLPVEAMVKVGMAKQQAYEQNVTKIQSEIDNIAGLDVMRDVDKNYLQSKLNELGNNLTKFAAADFSNFQLTNAVGGMTKQIVKDKYIKNAVNSTAWYRKQAADMETAIKEGKSSQSNIFDFNQKANAYFSSTDLNQTFSDRYTPYTDVKKKTMDAIKALHPELKKYDIPFEVVDGQINTKKIADAMQRYKIEGIDEGQIKAAILATFTPDDLNQLSIDARYQFRNVTPEQLVDRANQLYRVNKENVKTSLNYLEQQRGIVTDPTQLAKIEDKIEYYKKQIGEDGKPGELDIQLEEDLINAKNNPDAVKTSIYKDGFIKQFSNAFSWKSVDMEYIKNPMRDQLNWIAEMKLKQEIENRQRYEFSVTSAQKTKELQLKAEELALKNVELYGVDSPWVTLGNPTDNVLRANEMLTNHSNGVAQNYTAGENQLKLAGYSQEQINSMVNNTNASIPANAIKVVQEMRKQKNYLESLKTFQQNTRAKATSDVINDPKYKQRIEEADAFATSINGGAPITLYGKWDAKTKSSPTKTITPKEIINNINSGKAKFHIDAGQIIYSDGDIKVNIPRKAGFFGSDVIGGAQMRSVFEKISQYGSKGFFDIKKETNQKIEDKYKELLAPVVTKFVPQIKVLGADKDGSPTSVTLGKVSGLITATIARGVAADDVWDASTASSMLESKNSKDTRIFIQQDGENYQLVMKSESDPKKLQRIRLSKEEVRVNFGDKYVNDLTQESIRLDLGGGNTNISRNPTQSIMQKSFGDFPGIRRMDITADFAQEIGNPNLFIPGINIKKKDGRYQYFELSGIDKLSRVGFEQGKRNLNNLTDDVLLRYLKVEYPNYDYSQLDIK